MRRSIVLTAMLAGSALAVAAALCAAQEAPPLPEPLPQVAGGQLSVPTYGDARNVQLLRNLLTDRDPLVREKATVCLGQTHNALAWEPVRGMMKDADLNVRCAAVTAMAEFDPNWSAPVLANVLGGEPPPVVLTALRVVRQLRLASAAKATEALLSRNFAVPSSSPAPGKAQEAPSPRPEPLVAAVALYTLTDLGLAAPAADLRRLLADDSAAVRLRAAENALLAAPGAAPRAELLKVARSDESAVRAAAMAALGRSEFSSVEGVLEEAAKSSDPLLRRGAVWGFRYGGKADRLRPFLNDESATVLLAAIQAAGDLKHADSIPRLTELLLTVPDEQAHFAARDSLATMGVPAVADRAAEALTQLAPDLLRVAGPPDKIREVSMAGSGEPPPPPEKGTIIRNSRSCSWLLGHYRSKAAFDVQLKLVRQLPVDCPALIDLAGALVRIGDPNAVPSLHQALQTAEKHCHAYLVVQALGQGDYPPFSEVVAASLVDALGALKASEAVGTMVKLVEANFREKRLIETCEAAARVLPLLASDTNRAAVERAILSMLRHREHGRLCLFEACRAAGRLKMTAAVGDLQTVLAERDGRLLIRASAWALGQITGRVPPLPEPKRAQGADWIVAVPED